LRLFLIAALLTVLANVAVPPPVARAATIIVNSNADNATANDGDCTLREAINNANANSDTTSGDCEAGTGADVIILPADTYTLTLGIEDLNATGDLDILTAGGDLTIEGEGADTTIISGPSLAVGIDRVFHITGTVPIVVNISGVTIRNGDSAKHGGGIYHGGSGTLNIADCTLSGNRTTYGGGSSDGGFGGGIYNAGGTLNVTNSTLSNNTARGSVVNTVAGGGIFNLGTVNVANSTFSGNQATTIGSGGSGVNAVGGGLYSNGAATIINSTFSGNQADINSPHANDKAIGGGIANETGSATMDITNSTISGNQADRDGGGIINGGTLTVNNVTIADNTADSDSDGTGDGGGIYHLGGTTGLKNTIVAGNGDNSAVTKRPDVSGAFTSNGYNLIGDGTGSTGLVNGVNNDQVGTSGSPINPMLGPLANNSGPTETHALLVGSPAINQGTCTGALGTDQRGWLRPDLTTHLCDIGAYEYGSGIPLYLPIVLKGFQL